MFMHENISGALFSGFALPELLPEERIYDRLIGSWNVRVIDYTEAERIESAGEWHFSYALEGRAIQDVFIVPARSERTGVLPTLRNRYGTSIRSFHPDKREWTVTWINPVTGAINTLVAGLEGDDIVQDGTDADGSLIRWGFTDIKPDSVRWYGDRSTNGGNSWKLEAEFFLIRIAAKSRQVQIFGQ